jgi:membrane associated rhomboid family serine protease
MILPLRDDNTGIRTFPFVNYALIAMNVLVFLFLQDLGSNDKFTLAYACVPAEIVTGHDIETPSRETRDPRTGEEVVVPGLQPTPIPVYFTLFTAMFMHGGLMHLVGNMLFLWIFGDNVEDSLGHVRYLIFYLVCGLLASLAHVFVTVALAGAGSTEALRPSLGASGAISGVLAAYLLLHPHRQVLVLFFRLLLWVPGYVAIGLWFLFQLISGLGLLGSSNEQGGVAYAAHIGGFVAGLLLVKPFMVGRPQPPPQWPPMGRVAGWR